MNKAFYFIAASVAAICGTALLYAANAGFWHVVGIVGTWYNG